MASAEYHRAWNSRNREKRKASKAAHRARPGVKERERAYEQRRRDTNPVKGLVDLYKAAPCTDCGQRFPAQVMEFDHLDATQKTDDVAALVRDRETPSVVFAEIAKCELVCANCHRIRTLYRRMDARAQRDQSGRV